MLRQNRELTLLILTHYLPAALNDMRIEVPLFFKEIERLASSRGLPFVVKYVKESRNAVLRFVSQKPLTSGVLVSLDKTGFPFWLSGFKQWTKEPGHLKVLMTLLVSLRWVKLAPVLDTESITRESKAEEISSLAIKHSIRLLGIRPIKCEWKSFHISVKSGPIGQALLSSMTEVTLLSSQLVKNIISLGGSKLASQLSELTTQFDILPTSASQVWSKVFPPRSKSLRKISYFSDKEGKTRAIAILDYWSQSALIELHHSLNDILRLLTCDCTFDQNKFIALLKDLPIYFSIDLKSATDRMPITFQKKVMSHLIGEIKANAWADILVGQGFTVDNKYVINYKAGQPMGAYSSWPSMALSHHIMVQIAFLRTLDESLWPKLRKPFTGYALLGDDLVIGSKLVADQYFLLLKELDIDFSPEKTHVSETTYEFAKRWIHQGSEITGFSVGALKSVYKSYSLLHNLLTNQQSHGYELDSEHTRVFILSLYKLLRGKRYSFEHAERVVKLYRVFSQLSKDKITGNFKDTFLCIRELFGYSLPSDHLYDDKDTLYKLFLQARKKLGEKDLYAISMSQLAVNTRLRDIVKGYIEAWPDQDRNTLDFLWETVPAMLSYSSPLLSALNDLQEKIQKCLLSDNYSEIDSLGLSKYFISKGVFSMKRSESLVLAGSALTKLLIEVCKDARSEYIIKALHPNLEGNSVIYL